MSEVGYHGSRIAKLEDKLEEAVQVIIKLRDKITDLEYKIIRLENK